MKPVKATVLLAGVIAYILALGPYSNPAAAGIVLFSDNFNTENGGASALNYTAFANWTVSDGTVDLCKSSGAGEACTIGIAVSDGLFVDMDGSTSPANAGKLTSKTTFTFDPGFVYTLSFDLAGNQRDDTKSESVTVSVGTAFSEVFSIPAGSQSTPFTTLTRSFTVAASTPATISFDHAGGDNIGMLLDNVRLVAVPLPPGLVLVAAGLAAVALRPRRRP
jgi:hypothetical protein